MNFWLTKDLFFFFLSESQSNDCNVETEIPKSYEADDIDGFCFLSFATATDLDKFCTEQPSTSSSSTVLPQTEETVGK